ncbi:MAG: hypothetical protein C1943_05225 [Halochromatium sp.]|nr:hypothetical protein [Halochromatium sp.]
MQQQDGDENTRTWTATLREAVALGDDEGVAKVFSFLVWQNGEQITIRAEAFLEEFAPIYLAEEDLSKTMLAERLRIDMFRESVLAYLEGKEAEVDQVIERDIPAWIEANAPAVASVNLRAMEEQLGQGGLETHRNQIKMHQLFKLEIYERVLQSHLQKVWSGIELTLDEVIATAAR